MAQEKFIIKDESGDKNYFTIIPNYIANHSTANDQSLYFQMKRLAGEKGLCYATKSYFLKKMKVGYKTYKKSLNYLLEHKWILYSGKEKITTKGGIQEVDAYKINDIWKLNNDFYTKGVAESISPLEDKGVAESIKGGERKDTKGVAESNPSKNTSKEEHKEDTTILPTPSVGAEINLLIEFFKPINPSYEKFYKVVPQRKALERLLGKMGREKLEQCLKVLPKTNGMKYAPTITSPIQLEDKIGTLMSFIQKEKGQLEKNKIVSI